MMGIIFFSFIPSLTNLSSAVSGVPGIKIAMQTLGEQPGHPSTARGLISEIAGLTARLSFAGVFRACSPAPIPNVAPQLRMFGVLLPSSLRWCSSLRCETHWHVADILRPQSIEIFSPSHSNDISQPEMITIIRKDCNLSAPVIRLTPLLCPGSQAPVAGCTDKDK